MGILKSQKSVMSRLPQIFKISFSQARQKNNLKIKSLSVISLACELIAGFLPKCFT